MDNDSKYMFGFFSNYKLQLKAAGEGEQETLNQGPFLNSEWLYFQNTCNLHFLKILPPKKWGSPHFLICEMVLVL